MTTFTLKTNNSFSINTTVRESDEYTESVYIKFEMDPVIGHSARVDEMFMTTNELRNLGHFLVEQAKMIEADQKARRLK
jgi:hypothetical protein